MSTQPIAAVFAEAVQLIYARGTGTLNSRPQPCVATFPGIDGGEWTLAVNAHRDPVDYEPPGGMEVSLKCGELAIWWNGWLAGLTDAAGNGPICGGEAANEDSLLAAIAIARGARAAGER